jgi:3-oxoacyl-[acyl-carrier-protein] synthase-3
MDLSAACSGFVYGLITASQFVKNNACRNALVIGAESLSRTANIADVQTYPLFGDGAGAVLVSPGGEDDQQTSGILAYEMGAAGDLGHLITLPGIDSRPPFDHDARYVSMDGRAVFKWAVRKLPELVAQVLHTADLTLDDLDLVVFHQANRRIIEAAAEAMVLPDDKVFLNVERYGNTSAASIPLALDEALRQGRIAPDSRVLLCGFGAGLTWAATIFQGIAAPATG